MDLIREMLLITEKNPEMDFTREFYVGSCPEFAIPGYSDEQLAYHAKLLLMSGYVMGNPRIPSISGLTPDGQEFLASVKDRDIWETTKQKLSGLPSITLKVFASVAEAIGAAEVKKHLGL
jgi:hypothetical protein